MPWFKTNSDKNDGTHIVSKLSGDFVVPAGCTVIVGTYKMHRMPEHFPNPDVFDPDNFLPERTANRHYYAFVPFSAGPRSCVGRKYAMLKLKIILSTILRNFRVHSDLTEKDFRLQADIILKRAEGFKVRLTPRKPGSSVRTLENRHQKCEINNKIDTSTYALIGTGTIKSGSPLY
ncbi:cytochrome P450 4g15-like [Ctenocephalides felis]|uniref:cytochrome P450 4g15-like n=1 Tax=Ctenocephalides felis TaxID=7515 RepID=UPI000E6E35ED|nr:cytochrome P450 4g15-like [Ctenocephalides felis]